MVRLFSTRSRHGTFQGDPFAHFLQPPANESPEQQAARIAAEAHAKSLSDAIDQALQREAAAKRPPKNMADLQIILLGQSNAGKTTVLKQMRLMYDPRAHERERNCWKVIIYLNIIIAVRSLLDTLETFVQYHTSAATSRSPNLGGGNRSLPAILAQRKGPQALLLLRMRFAPLLTLELPLRRRLGALEDPEPLQCSKATRSPAAFPGDGLNWQPSPDASPSSTPDSGRNPQQQYRFVSHLGLRSSPRKPPKSAQHPPHVGRKSFFVSAATAQEQGSDVNGSSEGASAVGMGAHAMSQSNAQTQRPFYAHSAPGSDTSITSGSQQPRVPAWRASPRGNAQSALTNAALEAEASFDTYSSHGEFKYVHNDVDADSDSGVSLPTSMHKHRGVGGGDARARTRASAGVGAAVEPLPPKGRPGQIGDELVLRAGWQARISGRQPVKAAPRFTTLVRNALKVPQKAASIRSTAPTVAAIAVDVGVESLEGDEWGALAKNDEGEAASMLRMLCTDILNLWHGTDGESETADLLASVHSLGLLDHLGPTTYFLDHLTRVVQPEYVPTDQDILRARARTVGVTEETVTISHLRCHIFDVGGHRSQRAAWAQFFDDSQAIIFVAPLGSFDQCLVEDPSVNCLRDTLQLFQDVCRNRLLVRSALIVFMNKMDVLEEKLQAGVSFSRFHPKYEGHPLDSKEVCHWFHRRLVKTHDECSPPGAAKRELYIHRSIATVSQSLLLPALAAPAPMGRKCEGQSSGGLCLTLHLCPICVHFLAGHATHSDYYGKPVERFAHRLALLGRFAVNCSHTLTTNANKDTLTRIVIHLLYFAHLEDRPKLR
ncbi:G-alpha-domain-containing protein [Tilletiaria anomala UBC 951]|uniref:G-alpha-domain-containing protein n=1 Tax=Tilletiaria anomala (strain ATCC 24038 / CBS 436.72 / UBC 951) TaxID=1037660 RepID=A0A066W3W0_TILAU|nr:G-alpha-domain-containing protein [Tilletiaria anomala UBC 951]KDN45450.1 G-alpha-domain-containing protein [Tilletiaria anomala UBC 951]